MASQISPHNILNGYVRFKLLAITVCQLYYRTRKVARVSNQRAGQIVAASGMGMSYLLQHPSMMFGGRSRDVHTWGVNIYGSPYFGCYCQAFSNGPTIQLEWYGTDLSERQMLGHRHGLDTHLLLIQHRIPIISGCQSDEERYVQQPSDGTNDWRLDHATSKINPVQE